MSEENVKFMTLEDIFSDTDLATAQKMFQQNIKKKYKGGLAQAFLKEIIEPSIEMIDYRTGQENDPLSLANALEEALVDMSKPLEAELPLEFDAVDLIKDLVSLMKSVIEEHDFWHSKNCHVKMELRKKINDCREYLKDLEL